MFHRPLNNTSNLKITAVYCKVYIGRLHHATSLKGPKYEKFLAGIFTQIRPVKIAELETQPYILFFIGEIVLATSKKVVLDCSVYTSIGLENFHSV